MEKAFELLPHQHLNVVAQRLGVPPAIHGALMNAYSTPKVLTYAGASMACSGRSCRGIPAGDTISVFLMAMATVPLSHLFAQHGIPHRIYVDDIIYWFIGRECVQQAKIAHRLFMEWATSWSMRVSQAKTKVWASGTKCTHQLQMELGLPTEQV
eukprot:6486325-Amphidinium_carterae.1